MHGAVRERLVAVGVPILARQSGHVQRAAGQLGEVRDGARGVVVIEILQDVVADQEAARRFRRVVGHRPFDPAVAPAQIVARLQSRVARLRQRLGEGLAQQPYPAAGVENAPDRHAGMLQNGGDQPGPPAHFRGGGDARRRIEVVLAEVG